MKMINGVSMIPFGLLAGFADQNEITSNRREKCFDFS